MKPISDTIQIALSLPGPLKLLAALLLVLLCWQVWKSFWELLRVTRFCLAWLCRRLIKVTPWRMAGVFCLALPVYFLSSQISDALQYWEQVLSPAYVTSDTSTHALAMYEAELAKHCDTYECDIVKRRTREIAAKVGCTPLAIYEVAYSECGMNPFCVRTDGIAAGWIQFTSAGLPGILTDGRQTTLPEVKDACRRRDAASIMDWTEQYLTSRAKGVPLKDATGVYTCVFAPGHVGAGAGQVLYSGWKNPAYSLNSIFDGYYVDNAGRIMRSRKAQDGRITIGEMRLHLEAKKSGMLRN